MANEIDDLHHQAMEHAFWADQNERVGLSSKVEHRAMALDLERKAASLIPADAPDTEPSRSVLYRSAASLAYQIGDYAEARRLIAEGKTERTPPEIASEMDEILKAMPEEVNL